MGVLPDQLLQQRRLLQLDGKSQAKQPARKLLAFPFALLGPAATLTTHTLHRPVLGIVFKLSSVALLAAMTACVKYLGRAVPTGEVIFVRGLIALIVLILLAHFTEGLQVLKTSNPQRHAWRALCGTASMFSLFVAVTMIPLADVTAMMFAAPLFITLLAMIFLHERIHAFRWSALVIGLIGVTIMISPHLSLAHGHLLGTGVALTAAITAALAMIFLRSMSGGEPAITITFYFLLTATVCALATVFWGWVMPTREQWIALLLTGLFGVAGQLTMTYSYRYAEASTIAPLDYASMVFSVAIGYALFDETPSWSIWVGSPLVIAAGLIIFWRESRLALARSRVPEAIAIK